MRLSFSIAILAAAVFVTAQTNGTETEEPNRKATGKTECARVFVSESVPSRLLQQEEGENVLTDACCFD